ncbi:MAG: RNA polymerase sigma factor, partial [Pirellulales bacterium]
MDSTPDSLLVRVRVRDDDEAWQRFLKLVTPLVTLWAQRLGLRAQDVEELVQEVVAVLAEKMPEFSYDREKSFRGWLRTIATNKWRQWRRRPEAMALTEAMCQDLEADDPADAFWQEEFNDYLIARALEVMRTEFEPTTWKACWEHIAQGRRAADVGAELGISPGAVYVATS